MVTFSVIRAVSYLDVGPRVSRKTNALRIKFLPKYLPRDGCKTGAGFLLEMAGMSIGGDCRSCQCLGDPGSNALILIGDTDEAALSFVSQPERRRRKE